GDRGGEAGGGECGRPAGGGDRAGAGGVGVQLDRGAGLGRARDLWEVVVRGRGGRGGERRGRSRGARVLDVCDAARAARHVAGRVGRRRVERRRAVVGHRDGEAGRRERGRGAAGGDRARARRVRVQLDRRAGFGGAADRGVVVVRRRRRGDGERGRRDRRCRVLDVRDPSRARGDVSGRVRRGRVERCGAVVRYRGAQPRRGKRGGGPAARDRARAGGVRVDV